MENGLNRHPANPRPISSSLLQLPEAEMCIRDSNDGLSKIFSDIEFEESDSELDHAGDIDYIAKIVDKCIGIQIKPVTASAVCCSSLTSARKSPSALRISCGVDSSLNLATNGAVRFFLWFLAMRLPDVS